MKIFNIHKHSWSKWVTVEQGDIIWQNNLNKGFWLRQERVCTSCGKKQINLETVYL